MEVSENRWALYTCPELSIALDVIPWCAVAGQSV